MDQVIEFFQKLFWAESWPARWFCGEWTSFHGWLYIGSNLAVWAAYFAIPLFIFYFMLKRKDDLPFQGVFWLFILFILSCGLTHLMDATLFYYPAYRLSAVFLFITAVVSWGTIGGLYKVMPEALALKTPRQLEAIITQRTAELETTKKDLQNQNQQLREFAEITSHNLRSPVSNLVTLLDLYKLADNEQEKKEYLSQFEGVSDSLMETINDLSEVVKIKSNVDIKKEKLRFADIFQETKTNLSGLIKQRNAKIEGDFSACEEINYPKSYLQSIFQNLMSNALKYSSDERRLEIIFETKLSNGVVQLSCKDNGLGINMEKYDNKIFKLHKTFHGNEDARGVGLFIVKNQVETMGGTIAVKSEENVGSEFIINFNVQ